VATVREESAIPMTRQMTPSGQSLDLGDAEGAVQDALSEWRAQDRVERLWRGDASLWTGADEGRWLDWLHALDGWRDRLHALANISRDARSDGFRNAVVLGMGGSSLCPDVLSRTFGAATGSPALRVLDSTVPSQIRSLEREIDLERALFIVSSKSGSTVEPNVLARYFFERIERTLGRGEAGRRFVAITDPGSPLEAQASADGFRAIAHGVPGIGGRFSALSAFGLLPAALAGIDLEELLSRAERMVGACGPEAPPERNPGVALGVVLGTLAERGRDKVTLIASPSVGALGAWLEQLLAESTGKSGKGLVPVDGERTAPADAYGADRLFVYVRAQSAASAEQDAAVAALAKGGHPVVRIDLEGPIDLGAEFFRWEIATAAAGSVLGIHPFDQPDVDAAKVAARELMEAYEETGALPEAAPVVEADGLRLFAAPEYAKALRVRSGSTLEAVLAAHLGRLGPGAYFALNAYVEMNERNDALLQDLRHAVRDARGVATTVGYGPRYLHSTGQLHKGGPNSGVFLQITADDREDLAVPGQSVTFGILASAQAGGDFRVLAAGGRSILRAHLGPDVSGGLARLRAVVSEALAV
jgi:transaldolase/glucose-6-phosphate isomerase